MPVDLVRLGQCCSTVRQMVYAQEKALASMFLRESCQLRFAFEVYKSTILPGAFLRLHDLVKLKLRRDIIDQLTKIIVTEIFDEVYSGRIANDAEWRDNPDRLQTWEDTVEDITPFFLLLYHFLEAYRSYFVLILSLDEKYCNQQDITSLISSWILRHYNPYAAVRLCMVYADLLSKLHRKLRPPTYAGAAERGLRGWTRDPAKPEDCRDILVFSGLEGVLHLMSFPKYAQRMRAMDCLLGAHFGRSTKKQDHPIPTLMMAPLDRQVAKNLRARLPPTHRCLIVHGPTPESELAGVPVELENLGGPIYAEAGFGCPVFAANNHGPNYRPEPESASVEAGEGRESPSFIAASPRIDQQYGPKMCSSIAQTKGAARSQAFTKRLRVLDELLKDAAHVKNFSGMEASFDHASLVDLTDTGAISDGFRVSDYRT